MPDPTLTKNHPTGENPTDQFRMTTTQIGAIGETMVASGLVLASSGRLAPFTPFADDDGIDQLIYDKRTRASLPLQIKSRTGTEKAGTVQFDVRLSTFQCENGGLILYVLLDGCAVRMAWLIPVAELENVARHANGKLVIVASASPNSRDRFSQYRHDDLNGVAAALMEKFDA